MTDTPEIETASVNIEETVVIEKETLPKEDIEAILRDFGGVACASCNGNCAGCPFAMGGGEKINNTEPSSDELPDNESNYILNKTEVEDTAEILPLPSYKELLSDDAVPIVLARSSREPKPKLMDELNDLTEHDGDDSGNQLDLGAETEVFNETVELKESTVEDLTDSVATIESENLSGQTIESEVINTSENDNMPTEVDVESEAADGGVGQTVKAEAKPKNPHEVIIKIKHYIEPGLEPVNIEDIEDTIIDNNSQDFLNKNDFILEYTEEAEAADLIDATPVEEDEVKIPIVSCEKTDENVDTDNTDNWIDEYSLNEIKEPSDEDMNDDLYERESDMLAEEDDDILFEASERIITEEDSKKSSKLNRFKSTGYSVENAADEEESDEENDASATAIQDLDQSFVGKTSHKSSLGLICFLGSVAVRARAI